MPAIAAAFMVLLAAVADRFVDGWNWARPGFFLLGALVFAGGFVFQLLTRSVDSIAYRMAVGVALAAALVLVWMNRVQAADGVNRFALLFLVVPVVGVVVAAVSRFQPAGMARALFATALAQALILAITLPASPRALGLNGVVLILFAGSAVLFRRAGEERSL